jgi:hypothetical protein
VASSTITLEKVDEEVRSSLIPGSQQLNERLDILIESTHVTVNRRDVGVQARWLGSNLVGCSIGIQVALPDDDL